MRRLDALVLTVVVAVAASATISVERAAQAQAAQAAQAQLPGLALTTIVEIALAVALAGGALLLLARGGQAVFQWIGGVGKGGSSAPAPGSAAGQAAADARGESRQGNINLQVDVGNGHTPAQPLAPPAQPPAHDTPAPMAPGCAFAQLKVHDVFTSLSSDWRGSIDRNTTAVVELTTYLKQRDEVEAEVAKRAEAEVARRLRELQQPR